MPNNQEPRSDALDDLAGGLEPLPGPFGYHADFSLPFGLLERARMWVVRIGNDLYGPFNDHDEALRWALHCEAAQIWWVEPVRPPEDWPGGQLMSLEEPETPLLDLIDRGPVPDSVTGASPDASN